MRFTVFAMFICVLRRPRQQYVIWSTEMGGKGHVSRTSVANVAISVPQAHWKAPGQGLKIRFFTGVVLDSAISTVSVNFVNMSCIGMT